jgi:predicted nucleotidyltransferase
MYIEKKIVEYIRKSVTADIKSISIIGSYTLERKLRSGSDIDLVVVVEDLENISLDFDNIFYKMTKMVDSQGERIELNTKLEGVVLDVTLIESFNDPNNPLTDWYENHIGWCENSLCIYGTSMPDLFNLKQRKHEYKSIREKRLALVEEKIEMTERKIRDQNRRDLHIFYELQNYIFIREIIRRGLFNRQSLKHPSDAIPYFEELYALELKEKCGLELRLLEI